jgi:hypothetical protein
MRLTKVQQGTLNERARRIAYGYDVSEPAPNVVGVHTVALTFVATATDPLRLYNGTPLAAALDVWWDAVTLVEGADRMQFDGDTPDEAATGATYEWTGTPHASTSVKRVPRQHLWMSAPAGTAWSEVPAGVSWSEWEGP